ncbi:NADP-dependent oxidoreductase [Flavobacterium sp. DG1-102-2]|uniref:NADP-dependent oxidoreductase n=1 Tax=Flavobacterium sp. DG1-102-2 TaxID=3081663 RepID=UPI0029492456|nr:NADP-dependent oxidoreductase [Flavobacterium sp. DG1-102-2]MDV6170325.1 NADP-dependent oxidoreductase [Flavobacterium sp. DG1-102-2]
MKAIILNEFGGVENLRYTQIDKPLAGADEVVVQVKAISINPVDVKTRAGKGVAGRLKDHLPLILGWDISGIITEVGPSVTKFKVGDAVFGMVNFPGHGKAYAEYVAAPADQLALKPSNISYEEAAAATLAALTAWQAVTRLINVKKGDRVLVHAAAGGVGQFAVQIAKNLGAYVIGTSSAANKDFVLSLGTDEYIDYKAQPFEEVVSDVDFVFDSVGGENIDRSLKVIKKGGSIISIPSGLNDAVIEKAKALGINGYQFMVTSNGTDMEALAGQLERGKLKSHVSKVFSFDEMAEAHLHIESGRTVGKIVVTL